MIEEVKAWIFALLAGKDWRCSVGPVGIEMLKDTRRSSHYINNSACISLKPAFPAEVILISVPYLCGYIFITKGPSVDSKYFFG